MGALGVAYFDFLVGLVGVIHAVMRMQKDSWYPFCLPVGRIPTTFGPIPLRFAEIGLYVAFALLLILSIFLISGILLRQLWLINFWYCPNAIFLVVHAMIVIPLAFSDSWTAIATLGAFMALRVFAVLAVYTYLRALTWYRVQNRRDLDDPPPRYRQAMAFDRQRAAEVPSRRYHDLTSLHKMAINEETKAVSGAVFSRIENEYVENHGIPEQGLFGNDQGQHFENELPQSSTNNGVFHSTLFSEAKGRHLPPVPQSTNN